MSRRRRNCRPTASRFSGASEIPDPHRIILADDGEVSRLDVVARKFRRRVTRPVIQLAAILREISRPQCERRAFRERFT